MRPYRFLLGALIPIVVGFVPSACGGDEKSPGFAAAGAGGDNVPTSGGSDEGGSDAGGSGPDSGGSGVTSGGSGGASGGGEGGEGGGSDGEAGEGNTDACMPRDAIPDPVTASLDVLATCAAPTACGGDIEDIEWSYSAICLDREQIFDAVYSECPTSQLNGEGDVSISGSLTFSAGMATHSATITGTGVFQIPN